MWLDADDIILDEDKEKKLGKYGQGLAGLM